MRHETRTYAMGLATALVLTAASFAAVKWPIAGPQATLGFILALALLQVVVQFRCFLRVTFARSSRDDLQLVLFSAVIIALMVGGTLVILGNLRERMM